MKYCKSVTKAKGEREKKKEKGQKLFPKNTLHFCVCSQHGNKLDEN